MGCADDLQIEFLIWSKIFEKFEKIEKNHGILEVERDLPLVCNSFSRRRFLRCFSSQCSFLGKKK